MEAIKKQAEKYAKEYGVDNFEQSNLYDAFVEGAEVQKEEILEWHSPEELPTNNSEVLTKFICFGKRIVYDASTYKSGHFSTCFPFFDLYGYEFIGWRYIEEL